MAATKSGSVLQSSASNSAGGTTTSSTLDLSTAYGGLITAKVTNGATGPTAACTATVNVSQDGGTSWQFLASGTAGATASTSYPFAFEIPAPTLKAQVVFSGNTGQAVTVEAQAHAFTGI